MHAEEAGPGWGNSKCVPGTSMGHPIACGRMYALERYASFFRLWGHRSSASRTKVASSTEQDEKQMEGWHSLPGQGKSQSNLTVTSSASIPDPSCPWQRAEEPWPSHPGLLFPHTCLSFWVSRPFCLPYQQAPLTCARPARD